MNPRSSCKSVKSPMKTIRCTYPILGVVTALMLIGCAVPSGSQNAPPSGASRRQINNILLLPAIDARKDNSDLSCVNDTVQSAAVKVLTQKQYTYTIMPGEPLPELSAASLEEKNLDWIGYVKPHSARWLLAVVVEEVVREGGDGSAPDFMGPTWVAYAKIRGYMLDRETRSVVWTASRHATAMGQVTHTSYASYKGQIIPVTVPLAGHGYFPTAAHDVLSQAVTRMLTSKLPKRKTP